MTIAFGTDAGVYPHRDNAIQLHYHVDNGLKPERIHSYIGGIPRAETWRPTTLN